MTELLDSSISLVLGTLKRAESDCREMTDYKQLVSLFCIRVIPFILEHPLLEGVRRQWLQERSNLDSTAISIEKKAQEECIEAFHAIRKAIESIPHGDLATQIGVIERLIKGEEYFSFPLSRALFNEIQILLRMLLEGYKDICLQFCEIGTHSHLTGESPFYIIKCNFAPSVQEAYTAYQALSWENCHHPAIAWWYFESALWCWNTKATYFEEQSQLARRQQNFNNLCTKGAWQEIANVRDTRQSSYPPIIFTQELFKQGLKTLIADIETYFSLHPTKAEVDKPLRAEDVIFELLLDNKDASSLASSAIWISVTIGSSDPKYYYLKRFNASSEPLKFALTFLREPKKAGNVPVNLQSASDSIPKLLERIGLTANLRKIFFGKSQGNFVVFKGSRVVLSKRNIANFDSLIATLEMSHHKAGLPSFDQIGCQL